MSKFFTFSLIKNIIERLLKTYDDHIIREINEGRDETLRKLYRNYRRDFMSWAKNHFSLDAPLKNYLIGIGRFKLLQYLDKNSCIDLYEQHPIFNNLKTESPT